MTDKAVDGTLIELQTCHQTQYTKDGIKGEWFVRENITDEELHTLPSTISDKDMFQIMAFAKKFELKAFNTGIQLQKKQGNQVLMKRISDLEETLNDSVKHSDILAGKLEQYIMKEE